MKDTSPLNATKIRMLNNIHEALENDSVPHISEIPLLCINRGNSSSIKVKKMKRELNTIEPWYIFDTVIAEIVDYKHNYFIIKGGICKDNDGNIILRVLYIDTRDNNADYRLSFNIEFLAKKEWSVSRNEYIILYDVERIEWLIRVLVEDSIFKIKSVQETEREKIRNAYNTFIKSME